MKKLNKLLLLSTSILLLSCASETANSSLPEVSSEFNYSSSEIIESSSIVESSSFEESSSVIESSSEISSSGEEISEIPSTFLNKSFGSMEEMTTLSDFNPTLFKKESLKKDSERPLGDGVNHLTYSFNLNNGNKVIANVIEMDPNKAQLRTSKAISIETVNNQIVQFEEDNPSIHVMAGVNADFFATGTGGASVNAYIKDKKILKDGHNDKGGYDYKNLNNDIPASKPMLLGVSGSHLRIGPANEAGTIQENIQTKFTYRLYRGKAYEEATPITSELGITFNEQRMGQTEFNLVTHGGKYKSVKGERLVRIKLIESDGCFVVGKVASIISCIGQVEGTSTYYDAGSICLFVNKDSSASFEVGEYIGYTVTSPDLRFEGYTDIIGGRQSLVENGEIAPTVKLENSNGAQNSNIPRTCAGIKPNGKLLITTIEALRYGKTSSSESDSYGVNLPELAEFMRSVGCYDALNFDGGGSTQLITSDNNGTGTKELKVRSSDYGSYSVNSCRKIFNTLLVTTK